MHVTVKRPSPAILILVLGTIVHDSLAAKSRVPAQADSDHIQLDGNVRSGNLYVPGATVIVHTSKQARVVLTTDNAGRFQARVLPSSFYEVRACKEGYLPAITREADPSKRLALLLVPILERTTTRVEVTTRGAAGQPFPNATVLLLAPDCSVRTEISDASGHIQIHNYPVPLEPWLARSAALIGHLLADVVPRSDRPVTLELRAAGEAIATADAIADPFVSLSVAEELGKSLRRREISAMIGEAIDHAHNAAAFLFVAELLKRIGDSHASTYYERALLAEPNEPAYELFYADYLRVYRGANGPLFSMAERHYLQARQKLRIKETTGGALNPHDQSIRERVDRGVIALYQSDGLPIFISSMGLGQEFPEQPLVAYSSLLAYNQAITAIDATSDIRGYTIEAGSTEFRLYRSLTSGQLRGIVRSQPELQAIARLRFRFRSLPTVDVVYSNDTIQNAAITNLFMPNRFNSVNQSGFSVALSAIKAFTIANRFDCVLGGGVSIGKGVRVGDVEFLPNAKEDVNSYLGTAALSRYVGPDKVTVSISHEHQAITPQISDFRTFSKDIWDVNATYEVLRSVGLFGSLQGANVNKSYERRGINVSLGIRSDLLTYPQQTNQDILIRRTDYNGGLDFRNISGRLSVSIRPALFTFQGSGTAIRNSSQYRTNLSVLYRLVDEEDSRGIPRKGAYHLGSTEISLPIVYDVPVTGLTAFGNYRVGVQLDSKWYRADRHYVTIFGSVKYEFQRFYSLNKNQNLFGIGISIGFKGGPFSVRPFGALAPLQ